MPILHHLLGPHPLLLVSGVEEKSYREMVSMLLPHAQPGVVGGVERNLILLSSFTCFLLFLIKLFFFPGIICWQDDWISFSFCHSAM
jgi:hypothetical protein